MNMTTNPNVLVQDLVDAAGHVFADALNAFHPQARAAIGSAYPVEALELRVRAGSPGGVALWLNTEQGWRCLSVVG